MTENMPPEVGVPLAVVLTCVALAQRRRAIATWLGWGVTKRREQGDG